jgi:hypothetical protein
MNTVTLRNFLYLDTETVSNYLSTLEGYVETVVDETESKEGRIGAEGGLPPIKGSGQSSKSTSRNRKLAVTEEALFQRLYELLDEHTGEGIPYLTTSGEDTWSRLGRGNIVEIQARIRLPDIFSTMSAVEAFKPFMGLLDIIDEGNLVDVETQKMFDGFLEVGGATKEKPVPVFLEPIHAKRDAFFCSLSRRYLRCGIGDLAGEVTVFGKITRLIQKGTSEEVYTLLPEMQSLANSNRKDRRRLKSQKDNLSEALKGPAAILHPVAVYQ